MHDVTGSSSPERDEPRHDVTGSSSPDRDESKTSRPERSEKISDSELLKLMSLKNSSGCSSRDDGQQPVS